MEGIEIKLEQTNTGYKALITFNGMTDTIETRSAAQMIKELHYYYGVECSYIDTILFIMNELGD